MESKATGGKLANPPIDWTISQARALMRPKLKEGVECLCCGQRVQLYVRPLTSAMVHGLILLYRHHKVCGEPTNNFVHIEDYLKNQNCPSSVRGDLPKARFWGFIQGHGDEKTDGNPNNGLYKLLPKGIDFIEGRILVQKSVKLYNNKFYGFDGAETDVFACIKNKFDYSALMGIKKQVA